MLRAHKNKNNNVYLPLGLHCFKIPLAATTVTYYENNTEPSTKICLLVKFNSN